MATAAAAPQAAPLDAESRKALEFVVPTLSAGMELKKWLDQKTASHSFARRIEFVSTFTSSDMEPDTGFVFYDQAEVAGKTIPVTGVLQRMFFDRASATDDLARVRESLRAFAMRYFLRVCENRRPEMVHGPAGGTHHDTLQGFGFSQWFYRSGTTVANFPAATHSAIIDLREIGEKYEWIAVQGQMYNYLLPMRPFGVNRFQVAVPMKAEVAGFISPPLVINQDDPEPGIVGRYGVSFAMPALSKQGNLLAFGPGLFDPCLHQMLFEMKSDGTIYAEARLVVNQPDAILQLPVDPIVPAIDMLSRLSITKPLAGLMEAMPWPFRGRTFDPVMPSVDMANIMTAGQASHLGISRDDLIEMFLQKHFETDYYVLLNLLRTYRRVPDWTGAVPGWAATGVI